MMSTTVLGTIDTELEHLYTERTLAELGCQKVKADYKKKLKAYYRLPLAKRLVTKKPVFNTKDWQKFETRRLNVEEQIIIYEHLYRKYA